MRLALGLTIAALAAASTGAKAAIVDLAWDGGGRFEHRTTVAPGAFVEVCGPLKRGNPVRWRFSGSAASDFNIHYHLGKDQVVYPARARGVRAGSDTLVPALDQDYCWMWSNKGSTTLQLEIRLERLGTR